MLPQTLFTNIIVIIIIVIIVVVVVIIIIILNIIITIVNNSIVVVVVIIIIILNIIITIVNNSIWKKSKTWSFLYICRYQQNFQFTNFLCVFSLSFTNLCFVSIFHDWYLPICEYLPWYLPSTKLSFSLKLSTGINS